MADRLTQIQDCLEQLLTQMYAAIRYVDTRHSYASIDGQPDQFTPIPDPSQYSSTQATVLPDTQISNANADAATQGETQQTQQRSSEEEPEQPGEPSSMEPVPDPPSLFAQRLQDLAQDLVLKEQQIEALIATLPGIGISQEAQDTRVAELQEELARLEDEAKMWDGEKETLLDELEVRFEDVTRA